MVASCQMRLSCGFGNGALSVRNALMYEDPPRRMFIDMWPPQNPERGDVWVRLGEWRIWEDGKWEPSWSPQKMTTLPGYPRPGRRKQKAVGL